MLTRAATLNQAEVRVLVAKLCVRRRQAQIARQHKLKSAGEIVTLHDSEMGMESGSRLLTTS